MREIDVQELQDHIRIFKTKTEPAIIVANDGNETNGMTIGWLSLGNLWSKNTAIVYVHKVRYSKHIFDKAEYYSVNFLKDEFRTQYGYFGRVSGRDEDKMTNSGLTVVEDVAPYFAEDRVTVLCKILGRADFDINDVDPDVKDWYEEEGVHTLYVGEIVKVLVND